MGQINICFLRWSVILLICFLSSVVCGQERILRYPLDIPPLLSGNFGELRATHLHAGWDFKTGGREGVPVRCVKEGVLVRVVVSPTGYGKALYVEHAGGLTTVYAHLSRFADLVEHKVRAIQYNKESFAVDENVRGLNIRFAVGDTIAFSGNTGSSMGPHLHFEVRESVTERPLNPGLFLHVGDERAPNVRGVYVYHFSKEGYLLARRKFGVKKDGNGVYQAGKLTMSPGKIGFGIQADDFMKGSWNKLGVYDMRMYVKGHEVFTMRMDTMSFEQNRLVNELKDFDLCKKGEMVYTTFGNYLPRLLGVRRENDGLIQLKRDSVLPVEFVLSDINGNCSRIRLRLRGGDAASGVVVDSGAILLDYWRACAWRVGPYCLTVDSNAIPRVIKVESKVVRVVVDSSREREIFRITDRVLPLLKDARLRVKGEFSKKHVLCLVNEKGNLSPLRTRWNGQELWAVTRLLGSYSVAIDTISPEIRYLGVQNRNVCFRVRDHFSEIGVYRGEVNGKWCLFVYDAKRNLLSASLQEPVFRKGKNKVILKVEDVVGNIATFETDIVK